MSVPPSAKSAGIVPLRLMLNTLGLHTQTIKKELSAIVQHVLKKNCPLTAEVVQTLHLLELKAQLEKVKLECLAKKKTLNDVLTAHWQVVDYENTLKNVYLSLSHFFRDFSNEKKQSFARSAESRVLEKLGGFERVLWKEPKYFEFEINNVAQKSQVVPTQAISVQTAPSVQTTPIQTTPSVQTAPKAFVIPQANSIQKATSTSKAVSTPQAASPSKAASAQKAPATLKVPTIPTVPTTPKASATLKPPATQKATSNQQATSTQKTPTTPKVSATKAIPTQKMPSTSKAPAASKATSAPKVASTPKKKSVIQQQPIVKPQTPIRGPITQAKPSAPVITSKPVQLMSSKPVQVTPSKPAKPIQVASSKPVQVTPSKPVSPSIPRPLSQPTSTIHFDVQPLSFSLGDKTYQAINIAIKEQTAHGFITHKQEQHLLGAGFEKAFEILDFKLAITKKGTLQLGQYTGKSNVIFNLNQQEIQFCNELSFPGSVIVMKAKECKLGDVKIAETFEAVQSGVTIHGCVKTKRFVHEGSFKNRGELTCNEKAIIKGQFDIQGGKIQCGSLALDMVGKQEQDCFKGGVIVSKGDIHIALDNDLSISESGLCSLKGGIRFIEKNATNKLLHLGKKTILLAPEGVVHCQVQNINTVESSLIEANRCILQTNTTPGGTSITSAGVIRTKIRCTFIGNGLIQSTGLIQSFCEMVVNVANLELFGTLKAGYLTITELKHFKYKSGSFGAEKLLNLTLHQPKLDESISVPGLLNINYVNDRVPLEIFTTVQASSLAITSPTLSAGTYSIQNYGHLIGYLDAVSASGKGILNTNDGGGFSANTDINLTGQNVANTGKMAAKRDINIKTHELYTGDSSQAFAGLDNIIKSWRATFGGLMISGRDAKVLAEHSMVFLGNTLAGRDISAKAAQTLEVQGPLVAEANVKLKSHKVLVKDNITAGLDFKVKSHVAEFNEGTSSTSGKDTNLLATEQLTMNGNALAGNHLSATSEKLTITGTTTAKTVTLKSKQLDANVDIKAHEIFVKADNASLAGSLLANDIHLHFKESKIAAQIQALQNLSAEFERAPQLSAQALLYSLQDANISCEESFPALQSALHAGRHLTIKLPHLEDMPEFSHEFRASAPHCTVMGNGQMLVITREALEEMADFEYEEARTAKRRAKQKAVTKMLIGVALASGAIIIMGPAIAGLEPLVTAALKGAVFGGITSAVNEQDILKGIAQGAAFAAFGCFLEGAQFIQTIPMEALQEAAKAAIIATADTAVNGGKLKDKVLSSAGAAFVGGLLFPTAKAQQGKKEPKTLSENLKNLAKKGVEAAVAAKISKSNTLGMNLMAAAVGAMTEFALTPVSEKLQTQKMTRLNNQPTLSPRDMPSKQNPQHPQFGSHKDLYKDTKSRRFPKGNLRLAPPKENIKAASPKENIKVAAPQDNSIPKQDFTLQQGFNLEQDFTLKQDFNLKQGPNLKKDFTFKQGINPKRTPNLGQNFPLTPDLNSPKYAFPKKHSNNFMGDMSTKGKTTTRLKMGSPSLMPEYSSPIFSAANAPIPFLATPAFPTPAHSKPGAYANIKQDAYGNRNKPSSPILDFFFPAAHASTPEKRLYFNPNEISYRDISPIRQVNYFANQMPTKAMALDLRMKPYSSIKAEPKLKTFHAFDVDTMTFGGLGSQRRMREEYRFPHTNDGLMQLYTPSFNQYAHHAGPQGKPVPQLKTVAEFMPQKPQRTLWEETQILNRQIYGYSYHDEERVYLSGAGLLGIGKGAFKAGIEMLNLTANVFLCTNPSFGTFGTCLQQTNQNFYSSVYNASQAIAHPKETYNAIVRNYSDRFNRIEDFSIQGKPFEAAMLQGEMLFEVGSILPIGTGGIRLGLNLSKLSRTIKNLSLKGNICGIKTNLELNTKAITNASMKREIVDNFSNRLIQLNETYNPSREPFTKITINRSNMINTSFNDILMFSQKPMFKTNNIAVIPSSTFSNQVSKSNIYNANNWNAQQSLKKKMRALQNAQMTSVKTKQYIDGRIRYYEKEKSSKTPGPTRGATYVTEFNTKTGQVRSWYESYDQAGYVNRIHPKMIDGQDIVGQHYPPTETELNAIASKGRKK